MPIVYHKKDLFTAPTGAIVLHATNCKGVWGNGIAKTFSIKFPKAFKEYQMYCRNSGTNAIGKTLLIDTYKYKIGCLFTSRKYGLFKDSETEILDNTAEALISLINQLNEKGIKTTELHLPKINSGLFNVDWKKTERVIMQVDEAARRKGYNITWNVYAP